MKKKFTDDDDRKLPLHVTGLTAKDEQDQKRKEEDLKKSNVNMRGAEIK